MLDFSLLASIIAVVLSLASVILVIMRMGIGLGIEFVERKDIREMRKKIDDDLMKEYMNNLEQFVKNYPKEPKSDPLVIFRITELGQSTRYTQTASTLLKVISKVMSDLVKWIVGLISSSIIFVLLLWSALSLDMPLDSRANLEALAFVVFIAVLASVYESRKKIRNYMFLRTQFQELADNPSLSKAKTINDDLQIRELLYA